MGKDEGLDGARPLDGLMTPKQLAGCLKISRGTVQRHLVRGIPHERLGARIYFKLDDVMNWLRAQGQAAQRKRTKRSR
jgi:excisionase family DNA binding protein